MTSIKTGQIIAFETGEYSDFRIEEIVVFLKDCNLATLARQWCEHVKSTREPDAWTINQASFIGWLVAQSYAAPVKYSNIHLGPYGTLEFPGFEAVNMTDLTDD